MRRSGARNDVLQECYPYELFGTGSGVPKGTPDLHDRMRRNVIHSPEAIPNRATASIEYSEQLGRYRQRAYLITIGRPNRW